eukprot:TRINITY_DN15521_c0_g1_i1.p1 TRINITY_DN15521_c0_g1~~TRINITY_DN15521_c0_g1_i1.p1  ORF type:complete len:216 (-),score=39.26 TRINITY_DN15521_c0_g1_i1:50-697(-)
MDSKVLIDECNKAGVKLKNSALASITPDERDIVIAYLEQKGKPAVSSEEPSTQETLTPQREQPKMRNIKTMTSRPQPSRSSTQKSSGTSDEDSYSEEGSSGVVVEQEEEESVSGDEVTTGQDDESIEETAEVTEGRSAALKRRSEESIEDTGKSEADQAMTRDDYCLLYTSDAADDLLCVDLGGRRIIKKKKKKRKCGEGKNNKQEEVTHCEINR